MFYDTFHMKWENIYRKKLAQCLPRTGLGFPVGSVVKNPPASGRGTGAMGSIPVSGRFPGVESGNPLQYSFLENPMKRGACWAATVHGVAKSQIQLNTHA